MGLRVIIQEYAKEIRSDQIRSDQISTFRSGQVTGHTHSLTAVGALGYLPPPPAVLRHPHADRHRVSDRSSHISAPAPPRSTSSSPTLHTAVHDRVGQCSRPPRHVSKPLQLSSLYRVEHSLHCTVSTVMHLHPHRLYGTAWG